MINSLHEPIIINSESNQAVGAYNNKLVIWAYNNKLII